MSWQIQLLQWTTDPRVSAALGYINPGTDRRLAGELGKLFGGLQRELSFKSVLAPRTIDRRRLASGTLVELRSAPAGHPHVAIAVPRGNGRWATLRFGWRYDAAWGDANSIGHNPQPEIVGGFIFDVVVKLDSDRPFIELEEAA